jgi:hypothetical protein
LILRGLAALALAVVMAACTPPAQPETSPATTTVAINESTKSQIRQALARREAALMSKDLRAFQATVDLTRPAFRRCQQESFDAAARQGYAAGSVNSVKLIPTRETAGIVACQFVAFANSRSEHAPFIGIWRLWLAPGLDRVSDYERAVLRHEGLHYLQDQFIHSITVRLDWWLVEGWPDYIAKSRSRGEIVSAVCSHAVPTLKRIIDGVPTEPDTPPELTGDYYSLANSMIEYVYASYGTQTYWDLVALYKDNVDYRVNYPKIFGVGPDAFYQGWLAFAKKKYC